MQAAQGQFDFLLNTIPIGHDVDPYLALLKRDATMVILGAIEPLKNLDGRQLIFQRRRIVGSLIGGITETQEMLNFCGQHNICCDIEKINIDKINAAYDRTVKNDVKYRFVINMANL